MTAATNYFTVAACVLFAFAGAVAWTQERKDFFESGASFVSHIYAEGVGTGCSVRVSNGDGKGAISFLTYRAEGLPFTFETIFGHELGTGATHGARKGDTYEVRVDSDLLATGKIDSGVAPYEGMVEEWQGALLDALAYGETMTWGFPGQPPLVTTTIPDNAAMTKALVECNSFNPDK